MRPVATAPLRSVGLWLGGGVIVALLAGCPDPTSTPRDAEDSTDVLDAIDGAQDAVTTPDAEAVSTEVDDTAVEVDDTAVDAEDTTIDDTAIDDTAIDDTVIDDTAIDDTALDAEETAIDDTTLDAEDTAIDDTTVDDTTLDAEDTALDDTTLDVGDATLEDTALEVADTTDPPTDADTTGDTVPEPDTTTDLGPGDTTADTTGPDTTPAAECVGPLECGPLSYCTDDQTCALRLGVGAACALDDACRSGRCTAGACRCVSDQHCPSGQGCGVGGACEPKSATGDWCVADEDCVSALCDDGFCLPCPDDAACGPERYCDADLACAPRRPSGASCAHAGQCASDVCNPSGVCRCVADAHCLGSEVCDHGGVCRTRCDDGQTCPAAAPCKDGLCVPASPLGGSCATDADCAAGFCVAEVCVACLGDAHCAPSERCEAGSCQALGVVGDGCTADEACASDLCVDGVCRCRLDDECPAGSRCDFGACAAQEPPLSQCLRNEDCQGGACFVFPSYTVCVALGCGGDDANCGDGRYCSDAVGCVRQAPRGAACERDGQCRSGACDEHAAICVCTSDDDCASGQRCVDEACWASCQEGCAADHYCDPAVDACQPRVRLGEACAVDDACPLGLSCMDGRCRACLDDGDCHERLVCVDALVCRAPGCQSDAECGPEHACRFGICGCTSDLACAPDERCDDFGACSLRFEDGASCTQDAQCLSGACEPGALPVGSTCVACGDDGDCAEDQFCNVDQRVCVSRRGIGARCDRSGQCMEGTCAQGRCACESDADCPDGATCTSGVCDACEGDEDCVAPAFCGFEGGGLVRRCLAPRGIGAACSSNSQCAPWGTWTPWGLAFARPAHCRLDPGEAFGRCVECLISSDCRSSFTCTPAGQCLLNPYDSCDTTAQCQGRPCSADPEWADFRRGDGFVCLGASGCDDKRDYWWGLCEECAEDADCGANSYCRTDGPCDHRTKDFACWLAENVQPASTFTSVQETDPSSTATCLECQNINRCLPKRQPGGVCDRPGVCASGVCGTSPDTLGRCLCVDDADCGGFGVCHASGSCAECRDGSECAAGEYCSARGLCRTLRPPGTPCAKDEHCLTGSCRVVEATAEAELGLMICACAGDADCAGAAGGERCADGRCVECLDDGDCGLGGACVDEVCVECATHGECAADEFCDASGACRPALPAGLVCGGDWMCQSGVCDTLAPIAPLTVCLCVDDADCTAGVCDGSRCVGCREAADCGAGQGCSAAGDCVPLMPIDGPCRADGECDSGHCARGGAEVGSCVACLSDLHCALGEFCAQHRCVPKLAAGLPCFGDAWCAASGGCQPVLPGSDVRVCACGADAECAPDGLCDAGLCIGCRSGADCDAGQWCGPDRQCLVRLPDGALCTVSEQCVSGHCLDPVPAPGVCVACLGDADCPGGAFCTSTNACADRFPYGAPCSAQAQCESGRCAAVPGFGGTVCACSETAECPGALLCHEAIGVCQACVQHSDCAAGAWCDDGTCEPKVPYALPCGGDAECLSGACGSASLPGLCVCQGEADCAGDDRCDTGTGRCEACLDGTDCPEAQWCKDHDCVPLSAYLGPCSDDEQCLSGSCGASGLPMSCACQGDGDCQDDDVCDPGTGLCEACVLDGDCPAGRWCNDHECVPQSAYLGPCNDDAQCLSGSCGASGLPTSCACQDDGDCLNDLVCDVVTGLCESCVDATDCPEGQWCKDHDCVPQSAYLGPCRDDAECLSGSCGASGLPMSCACHDDGDCPNDLVCDVVTGLCKECLGHADCTTAEYCFAQSCLLDKPPGLPCQDDEECLSGICHASGMCL